MTRHHRVWLAGIMGIWLVLGPAAALPYGGMAAQPARTPRGQGPGQTGGTGGLAATLEAQSQSVQLTTTALSSRGNSLSATKEALSNLALTAEAKSAAVMATVQAGVGSISALATEVAATAQYLATTVDQSAESVQATVTAISSNLGSVSAELEALLSYFGEQGSISYENGTLTVTMFITEAQANDLLDVLVQAAGYDPEAMFIDTRADGTVQVILVDASADLNGTVVMTYSVAVVEGAVSVQLVSVTLNGRAVPVEMISDDLLSAIQLGVTGAAVQPMLNVPQTGYTIETLSITHEGILLSVQVQVQP